MEATIKTNDHNAFQTLVAFLKSMKFDVEIKKSEQKLKKALADLTPMTLDEFYERNRQSQNEIAEGLLITQNEVKKHFINKGK